MEKNVFQMLEEAKIAEGREQVYEQIRKVFEPDDMFKGRIYFTSADDLIQTIITRLKRKNDAKI